MYNFKPLELNATPLGCLLLGVAASRSNLPSITNEEVSKAFVSEI